MTNTPQTEPLSLLDGVEPDARLNVEDQRTFGITRSLYGAEVRKLPVGDYQLYTREKLEPVIEALLEAQRAKYEARIEANRKQVLLDVLSLCESLDNKEHIVETLKYVLNHMARR
jgi:hypothetical protein